MKGHTTTIIILNDKNKSSKKPIDLTDENYITINITVCGSNLFIKKAG